MILAFLQSQVSTLILSSVYAMMYYDDMVAYTPIYAITSREGGLNHARMLTTAL